MELLDRIKQNARKHNMRIVLPEGYEERTIKAADIAIQEELAQIILIRRSFRDKFTCCKTWIKEHFKSNNH